MGGLERPILTLVEEYLARPGARFLFKRSVRDCDECRFLMICNGNPRLEDDRLYEVVEVRRVWHPCPLGPRMRVVAVREAEYEVYVMPRYAVEGMVFSCGASDVILTEASRGLKKEDKLLVVRVYGDVIERGPQRFVRVSVRRLPRGEPP